jgi:dephospho-CoA kinase
VIPRAVIRPRRARTTSGADSRRPLAVAVTGGIGAGKSEALRSFARHGAATISSDDIVHELLRGDSEVKSAVRERWGSAILAADGEIDRRKVGKIVFSDRSELAWLESLLHPRVAALVLEWRRRLADLDDAPAVCAVEVPLLYEVGGETRFDAVVVITASPQNRASRTGRSLLERESRLLPDDEKIARADFAYVNDGALDDLDAFVASVMTRLAS